MFLSRILQLTSILELVCFWPFSSVIHKHQCLVNKNVPKVATAILFMENLSYNFPFFWYFWWLFISGKVEAFLIPDFPLGDWRKWNVLLFCLKFDLSQNAKQFYHMNLIYVVIIVKSWFKKNPYVNSQDLLRNPFLVMSAFNYAHIWKMEKFALWACTT